jgi:hypothetical protein
MDFSGLKAAAQKQKDFEENKSPKFFNTLKSGRYIALFLWADSRTSKKNFQENFWLTFEMVKVLEGEQDSSCEGKRNVDMIRKNEYLMQNISKMLHQIAGVDYDEMESDMAEDFFKGMETEEGLGEGRYANIPIFVNISSREVTKDEVTKTYYDVDYSPMTVEDCEAHGVEELAELI